MRWCQLVAAGSLLAATTASASLTPPVLPLVVRNPYLSTWLANARDAPWEHWPMFYTGQEIGLSVLASVAESDTSYPLLGRPQDSLRDDDGYNISYPVYVGPTFDASTTNLTYLIPPPSGYSASTKPLEVVLSFLSPITPTSTLRQSIPASYLTVYVTGSFNIDIYVDVNGQWVSGDRGSSITWDLIRTGMGEGDTYQETIKSWKVRRETELLYTENADRAEWGELWFSAPAYIRYECGTSAILRQRFSKTGTLENTIDPQFREIMDEEPVFAFSKSFSLNNTNSADNTSVKTDKVVFTIGHIQNPVVQYASARGMTDMRPLWMSIFLTPEQLLLFHYLDYHKAHQLAANYSETLEMDADQSGSYNYVDIVALSARQVMGATSFSGTPENPILFLKEISSNGNAQTIDVIFPAFPFFLYTNPRWLAYLLEPLIEHMLSGQYPNKYAMHDLGTHFPNETGHPDGNDEYMPVEECGNILIMGLSIVNSLIYDTPKASQSIWAPVGRSEFVETDGSESIFPLTLETRDQIWGLDDSWGGGAKGVKQAKKWVERSYTLWKQWTGYLEEFTLLPHNQLSTDDFAGWLANQTNLALKGIVGIRAMAAIADVVGNTADAKYYTNLSEVYIEKWEEYGISRDGTHAKLAYTWYGSWTTLYNLFGSALLCFDVKNSSNSIPMLERDHQQHPINPGKSASSKPFIGDHIYKMESDWYHFVRQKYGLPLDSRHLYTKSDWEFFAAAVASKKVRTEILEATALWLNETVTDRPFTDLFETEGDGNFPGPNFFARPVIGGHFSFLALERACGGKAVESLAFLDETEEVESAGMKERFEGFKKIVKEGVQGVLGGEEL